jgi:hypothetical protein
MTSLNAFGKHGAIISDPTWILWVERKSNKSERYGDRYPITSTNDMDLAIEWIRGGYTHRTGVAPFMGYVLYQLNVPSKRVFRHAYNAPKTESLYEKIKGKWTRVP